MASLSVGEVSMASLGVVLMATLFRVGEVWMASLGVGELLMASLGVGRVLVANLSVKVLVPLSVLKKC